jgi:L-lactate dehydrogenase complex protein LldG
MIDTSATRAAILSSIRSAYSVAGQPADEYSAIPREYLRTGSLDPEARLELFAERLREYDAGVHFAATDSLADAISKILTTRGKSRVLVPNDLPSAWLPDGFQFMRGNGFSPHEIDSIGAVLTGCAVAIALTGTLVLQNATAQGPRALSLVPDYHLCVVFPGQIVETVSEAFDRLESTKTLPTTLISGPSATADIEMTRIKGVHGPRFLDVIVAEQGPCTDTGKFL